MSPERVEALALELYDAFNERDFDRASELLAEDAELRNLATGEVLRGAGGYTQAARGLASAFPDGRIEVARVEVTGGAATVEMVWRGTHTGTLIGAHGHVPPTWAQVEIPVCQVLRFEGDRVRSAETYLDTGSMLRQMGLLPNSPLHGPDRRASLELYALETESSVQQRNKATVRRFVDLVINRRDAAAAADLCIANLGWHAGAMGEARDLESYQRQVETLFRAFPDLYLEIADAVAEGDRVSVRARLSGTHRGSFRGVPPTGKRIHSTGASTYRVVDGRIVEEWWTQDLFGILQQIDALPSTLSPASLEG